jgi:hypothetical protein
VDVEEKAIPSVGCPFPDWPKLALDFLFET